MRARWLLGLVGAAAALLLVGDALLGAAEPTEVVRAALLVDATVLATAELAGVLMLATLDDEVTGADAWELLWDTEARAEAEEELNLVAAGSSAEALVVGPASPGVVGNGTTVYELAMAADDVMAVELAGGRTMTQRASTPARSSAPRTEDETRMLSIRPEDRVRNRRNRISSTPDKALLGDG